MTASVASVDSPKALIAFRKVYHALGFSKAYNFILFFIVGGALFGFTLARFSYLNFDSFCPPDGSGSGSTGSAGECYWYRNFTRYKVGIILHLATILPASLIAIVQFVPIVRRKCILYHRIAGYTAISLAVITVAAVFMIADRAFGGGFAIQSFVGVLGLGFLTALGLALYNIKMKQIDQHRAWMLRGWLWAGSIITLRIIMIIAAQIISLYSASEALYVPMPCDEISYIIRDDAALVSRYPICAAVVNGTNTLGAGLQAAVRANFNGVKDDASEQLDASLQAVFGGAAWLALALHVAGVEIYLKLTPKEAERLRQVSYERQMEKGMKHPGSAGLVIERLGDAEPWSPRPQAEVDSAESEEKLQK